MRSLSFQLMERLRFCSSLGTFLVDLRRSSASREGAKVGIGTIRKLESAGVRSVQELAAMDEIALLKLGVQQRFARQILAYVKRRQQ
jgi:helicase